MKYSDEIDNKDLHYLSVSSAIVLALSTGDIASAKLIIKKYETNRYYSIKCYSNNI